MQQKSKSNASTYALKVIRWFTANKYTEDLKTATLNDLNKFVKEMAVSEDDFDVLTKQTSLLCLRPLLLDNMSKVGIISYFRRIMINAEVCQTYKKLHIPLLVARTLEKESSKQIIRNTGKDNRRDDSQAKQCLKFIEKWINVAPSTVPKLLISSLVGFAELPVDDPNPKREKISVQQKRTAVEVLRNLSSKNPELCAWSGGISLLLSTITDPYLQNQKSPQQAMLTLLYLINQPNVRNKINLYLNIKKIFWIFTDIDYGPDVGAKNNTNVQRRAELFQAQLNLGKKAVIKILKSWAGLIYLGSEMSTLRSFIQSLRQKIRPEVRVAIYEVLESLLMIGNTASTYRESSGRLRIANLLNCYLITLVQLLIDCDLFKILVQLSGLEDTQTTVPAQKFLKQLTILMFNSLPNSSKYIDFLISAASQYDEASLSLKSCSSFVINKIGNYTFDNRGSQDASRLVSELQNIYTASTLYISLAQGSLHETTHALGLVWTDNQQKLKSLYQSTAITRETKDRHQKWRWEAIQQILKHPYDNKTKARFQNDKFHENKIIKYLLRFYTPAKKQFSSLEWKMEHFQYIKVGQLLVKNIINMSSFIALLNEASTSQFEITVCFMDELKQTLINLLNSSDIRGPPSSFYLTLERELILWLPLFTENKRGFQDLLVTNQIFELLEKFIEKPQCDYILSVILFYFDYNKDNYVRLNADGTSFVCGPRDFLQKCILRGSRQLALQGIEVLKMLYKMEAIGYNVWGFKLLAKVLRLYDNKHPDIMAALMDAIQEMFLQQENLADFIEHLSFPDLLRIKDSLSANFLIHLISTVQGFNSIKEFMGDWLDQEYDSWIMTKNSQYNAIMGNILDSALDFAEPKYEGYSLKEPSFPLQLLYVYKLPWVARIDQSCYPLYVSAQRNSFNLEAQLGVPLKIVKPFKFNLQIGMMAVSEQLSYDDDKQFLAVEVRPDDKMYYAKREGSLAVLKKGGVTYYFMEKSNKEKDVHMLCKIRVELRIRKSFDNTELPTHLIGELAKTNVGLEYLRQKNTMETLKNILQKDVSPSDIKAALWAVGHLGCSNIGMALIKEYGVIDTIIHMSESHPFISLRGTCRYILNMICSSSEGRKEISERGWLTNRNSNIGWICVPSNSRSFFEIKKVEDNYWMTNDKAWSLYQGALEPLNEKEKKMLHNISLLSNTLSHSQARNQIKELAKLNPELTSSSKLLKNVLLMMTFYKFRIEMRRSIVSIFDELIRNPKFLNDPANSKIYII